MASKRIQENWKNMSKQARQRYLINNVKSAMGRAKHHDVKLVKASDDINDVAVDLDFDIDDDIQGVRINCGIDNADAFSLNDQNLHLSPSNLIKDNLFEEDQPYNCDNNALKYDYRTDTLRAINLDDVLDFGRKVIEYLKDPSSQTAKQLVD